ncbi:MAG TPA: hypothetical protein VHC69_14670 [Polyangiaceae bacterium]|nr:hypothetical protein [Polyangiaceae bacterium]
MAVRWTLLTCAAVALGCQSVERFDTKGNAAYCGNVVDSEFVLTPSAQGGFDRQLGMKLKLDTTRLSTNPGTITTNDADGGPCNGAPTFDDAELVVTTEIENDPLSTVVFDDGQVQNIIAWIDSTCRGKMLGVVSLYKSNRVEVRLLKPGTSTTNRDAFALFRLDRSEHGCGY